MTEIAPDSKNSERQAASRRRYSSSSERLIKWSTASAVLCVAAVAAVVSYEHAYALVRRYGEQGWTARLVPLTVDGLIYASSMVMLHCARHRIPVPQLARWLLGLGIAATLAANATHGLGYGVAGAVIAAWPAVALVGSYELLMVIIRHTPDAAVPAERAVVSTDEPAYSDVPEPVSVPDPLRIRALEEFAEELANGSVPSIRRIRSRLRVGQPKAQDIRAYLASRNDAQREVAA